MTSNALRLRRLARLIGMGEAVRRACEQRLADALQGARAATDHRQRVALLLEDSRAAEGPSPSQTLAAAAQLRTLLHPADAAAQSGVTAAGRARLEAERRLLAARARQSALEAAHREALQNHLRETERRQTDAEPPHQARTGRSRP